MVGVEETTRNVAGIFRRPKCLSSMDEAQNFGSNGEMARFEKFGGGRALGRPVSRILNSRQAIAVPNQSEIEFATFAY